MLIHFAFAWSFSFCLFRANNFHLIDLFISSQNPVQSKFLFCQLIHYLSLTVPCIFLPISRTTSIRNQKFTVEHPHHTLLPKSSTDTCPFLFATSHIIQTVIFDHSCFAYSFSFHSFAHIGLRLIWINCTTYVDCISSSTCSLTDARCMMPSLVSRHFCPADQPVCFAQKIN